MPRLKRMCVLRWLSVIRDLHLDKGTQPQPGNLRGIYPLTGAVGNLAIMIPRGGILDPWLCVSRFRVICLYRTSFGKVPIKRARLYARLAKRKDLLFGNLAIMIPRGGILDPW